MAGGTKCSSAFKIAHEHILANYASDSHDVYVYEFSDGDNFMSDNIICVEYIQKLLSLCKAIGYGEIILDDTRPWMQEENLLSNVFNESINRTRFVSTQLTSRDDVFVALKKFFNIKTVDFE